MIACIIAGGLEFTVKYKLSHYCTYGRSLLLNHANRTTCLPTQVFLKSYCNCYAPLNRSRTDVLIFYSFESSPRDQKFPEELHNVDTAIHVRAFLRVLHSSVRSRDMSRSVSIPTMMSHTEM